jgi:hypothetical protein
MKIEIQNSNKRAIDTALCEIGSASKLTQGPPSGKQLEINPRTGASRPARIASPSRMDNKTEI